MNVNIKLLRDLGNRKIKLTDKQLALLKEYDSETRNITIPAFSLPKKLKEKNIEISKENNSGYYDLIVNTIPFYEVSCDFTKNDLQRFRNQYNNTWSRYCISNDFDKTIEITFNNVGTKILFDVNINEKYRELLELINAIIKFNLITSSNYNLKTYDLDEEKVLSMLVVKDKVEFLNIVRGIK